MPRVVITVSNKNSQPYRFQLDRERVTIGRSRESDIVVDCPSVSGLHCTMERVKGGYILRDQNSTNGLKLDDEKMAIIDLRNDIDVYVGDTEFEYSLSEEELDELDDEDFVPHAKKASEMEDTDDVEEDEEAPKSREKPAKKKAKALKTPSRPAAPAAPSPALPSANSGGSGFFGIAVFVCGLVAFYAGLDSSYRGDQKDLGRTGDISLFGDIKDGAPPAPKPEDEEE